MSNLEQTLSIIKPDAVERNLDNEIKEMFKDKGFKIVKVAETKILNILKKENIKFICLAGFMKVLSKDFIKKFSGRIINIHPSLLPKYKGLNTHIKAIQNKDKVAGCTVHFVTAKLDSFFEILTSFCKIIFPESSFAVT